MSTNYFENDAAILLRLAEEQDPVSAIEGWIKKSIGGGYHRSDILRSLESVWSEDPVVFDELIERVRLGRYDDEPPDRRAMV